MNSVGSWSYILARHDLPDDVAYRLAKALHNGHAALMKRLDQAKRNDAAEHGQRRAERERRSIPACRRYLREISVLH